MNTYFDPAEQGTPAGTSPSTTQAPTPQAPQYGAAPQQLSPAPQAPVPQNYGAAPSGPAPEPPARDGAPSQQPGAGAATRQQRVGMAQETRSGDLDIAIALRAMMTVGASDLHLTSGAPPMVRLDGQLAALPGYEPLSQDGLQRSLYAMLTQKQREEFEERLELDFSHALVGEARFRVNIYRQRDSVGAAFRMIPYEIKSLDALGIPEAVNAFAALPRGLVLVTGPTGSGKSTTLASLVDLANRSRSAHIMTVEDPIEFLHRHKRSLVNQREVGADTHSFQAALRHVLRQDPDIILIGEMRDLETIQVALTAAETGHLVFATLHTQDAAQTIDRIIDVFPAGQQGQVRTQLATAIQGILCQTLLRRADGPGRAAAVEVLIATPAIRNLIREGKVHQIYTALQAGANLGMQTMDQHLAELVKNGAISYEVGAETCHSVEEFKRLCGRVTT
ncbi:PilT/PilU family type 4a pilus ATPase [Demequina sp.]|uniref:PilT/PilU family type 4a pilus ATPase n=1 Tax=Demequina sp. TaxID=2050685 RepID=UPI0025C50CD5|nr:PilT/PilU family type 4a pilus ATPase [Demequina sp.]